MPNKTIYISEKDEQLFENAKTIAGESLSTVIALSLREYIIKNKQKEKNMKEISVLVGSLKSQREQHFVGAEMAKWQGFSDDGEWYQEAVIYNTEKDNWAIYLKKISKASVISNPLTAWMKLKDSMVLPEAKLLVCKMPNELSGKVPVELMKTLKSTVRRAEKPVEYLDI